ncbi:MAG: class I SAM-dependent methyltransferase [Ardenticatenaceae bacterium]
MKDPQPWHEIVWTPAKAELFWNYVAQNAVSENTYFSKLAGPSVISNVKRHIQLKGRIVDYGCGTGLFMEHLLKENISCEGMDFSLNSINIVTSKFKNNLLFRGVHHITSLPTSIDDESVDIVFFLETIEHVLPDDLAPTLKEIHRILRPGGYVIVTTPNSENLDLSQVICADCGAVFHRWQHVRSFMPESLSHLMDEFGFRCLICSPTLFVTNNKIISTIKRYFKKIIGETLPNLLYIGSKKS